MKLTRFLLFLLALAIASASVVGATNHESGGQLTEGEVRKVDRDAKKITIRHGPIVNLDMPAMTMVFQVRDAALLEKVQAGDKVRFAAEKTGGAYAVTHIETAR
jgi:Cu/Ag efflux protein CusF